MQTARWCNTFVCKLRGFTLRRELKPGEGLVLVEKHQSRVSTAITMLFVFFDLGVLWVNDHGRVVDTALARPWRLSYTPRAPALYAVEGHPNIIEKIKIGDHVRFIELTGE